jgi:hypothetical protein
VAALMAMNLQPPTNWRNSPLRARACSASRPAGLERLGIIDAVTRAMPPRPRQNAQGRDQQLIDGG